MHRKREAQPILGALCCLYLTPPLRHNRHLFQKHLSHLILKLERGVPHSQFDRYQALEHPISACVARGTSGQDGRQDLQVRCHQRAQVDAQSHPRLGSWI